MNHQSSSLGGLLVALVLLMMLAMFGVGALLFLLVARAPAPAVVASGPGPATAPLARPSHVAYQVQPRSCVRLPSGDCRVILSLSQVGQGSIDEFALKVAAGNTKCVLESPPLTSPFPPQADVVVRVPKDAVGEESTLLQISTTTKGRVGYFGTFGSSRSSSVTVSTPEAQEANGASTGAAESTGEVPAKVESP